ncbi:hypothetical protein [Azovibrio restrictus]|uniref:hypothetical protein n=1 Tax=Azovibrio restrictus TaxID=146938 RepID=UPI0012EC0B1C|nr:hypothetical protein [Azovibrio restrictus]
MNKVEPTQFPGERLASYDSADLANRFFKKFRIADAKNMARTWTVFSPGLYVEEVGFDVLLDPFVDEQPCLYISSDIRDSGICIHKARASEIRDYFKNLPPWEDQDWYIFDSSLEWCIAVTHELIGGARSVFWVEESASK